MTSPNPNSPQKPPSNPKIDLAVALTVPMLVHRVFFISPLILGPDKRLRSSTILVLYYCLAMAVYTANMLFWIRDNTIWTRVVIEVFGYIWYGISTIDFLFGRFSFFFLVSMSLHRRAAQIEFFHSIAAIDHRLRRNCGHQVRYERLFYGYLVVLIVCALDVYFELQIYLVPVRTMMRFEGALPIVPILITFVVDRTTILLITCAVVACTILITTRLQILTKVMEQQNVRRSNEAMVRPKFVEVLNLFVELCRLIELLNNYVGGIMVMRFAHDFVTITTSAYLMLETAAFQPERVSQWGNRIGETVFIFLAHLARPTIVCLSGEWMVAAAEDCRSQLYKYVPKTPEEEEVLCSFHYWSLHQRLRFSAAQFLDINAAMLYAIMGALSTYLFVLIQFQQLELELLDEVNGNSGKIGNYTNSYIL